jgi:hypothetical protein
MLPDSRRSTIGSAARVSAVLAAILLSSLLSAPVSGKTVGNPPAAESPAEALDTASFVRELGRLKSNLEIARKSPATLQAFRESLPSKWVVKSGDQQYDVPTSPLTTRIDKAERDSALREFQLNQARDFLDALAAEALSSSGTQPENTSSARAALNRILARNEFASGRKQSWWDRFRELVNELLYDAFLRLLSQIGGQKSMGEALLWLGVCAAAILIAYWIFRRWFRAARMDEIALQSAGVPIRSWQQWVFLSRGAASQGDYRMAIHCAYWAGITRLEELGALPADRAKTPREYLKSMRKSTLLASETHTTRYQALSLLTSRLEKIWYGYHLATETDVLDSLAQLEVLGCHLP